MSPQLSNRGIVVGVDGSPSSTVEVEWAARDAEMRNVPLRLVHVVVPLWLPLRGGQTSLHLLTVPTSRRTRRAKSSTMPTSSPPRPSRRAGHRT